MEQWVESGAPIGITLRQSANTFPVFILDLTQPSSPTVYGDHLPPKINGKLQKSIHILKACANISALRARIFTCHTKSSLVDCLGRPTMSV